MIKAKKITLIIQADIEVDPEGSLAGMDFSKFSKENLSLIQKNIDARVEHTLKHFQAIANVIEYGTEVEVRMDVTDVPYEEI